MGSSVAKQPLQGLTAQPLARLAQRAGADGFIVLPRQCQPSTSATFTMERSLSKATPNTSQSACSMGSRRLRSVATPSSAKTCSIHLLGMLLLNDTPCSGLANSWVSFRYSYRSTWLSLDLYGQSSIDQACMYKQQRPRRAFA